MTAEKLRWRRLDSKTGPDLPLFRVRIDTMQHPSNSESLERLVLESADWVNVVAICRDQRLVMVEQFRFGIGDLTIEPAAGIVESGEDSLAAGKRELLEESGYAGGHWRYLGSVQPNPAVHNNVCHHWLAENVEPVREPTPDPGEEIRVHLMTQDDIKEAIAGGRLRHSLAISALSRVFHLWDLPHVVDGP